MFSSSKTFKRLIAKASLLFLLLSVISSDFSVLSMPQAQAASAIMQAGYEAVSMPNGNKSLVFAAFDTSLTSSGSAACGAVPGIPDAPAGSTCYTIAGKITVTGSGRAEGIDQNDVVRMVRPSSTPPSDKNLMIIFNAGNVFTNASQVTITLTGFGGINGTLTLPTLGTMGGEPPPGGTGGVQSVILDDPDTTGFGLDGKDFRVRWTPNGTQPNGYTNTRIFVVPSTNATINSANVLLSGCNNNPCQDVGFFTNYSQNSHVLSTNRQTDSHNTAWNVGTDYKACVFIDAGTDTLDCSSVVDYANSSDSGGTDTSPPFISHIPVNTVISGTPAVIHAVLGDDQIMTPADFNSQAEGNPSYAQLRYGTNLTATANSVFPSSVEALGAPEALDEIYIFTTAEPVNTPVFRYYLFAQDNATPPNQQFFGKMPGLTGSNIANNPIEAQVVAAGARTVSGTIRASGNQAPIQNAYVFLGGLAKIGDMTDENGAYTITGVPSGGYDVTAIADGYCPMNRYEMVSNSNLSNINLNLNLGPCMFYNEGPAEPGGGMGGKPFVMFSGPPNGGMASPSENIRAGFNVPLNPQSVNDDSSDTSESNVYLENFNGDVIAGTVLYCANQSSAGCSSIPLMDTNVIMFNPNADLGPGSYTLIITERVLSEQGQSVEGNRPGGGHEIMFNVNQTIQAGDLNQFIQGNDYNPTGGQYMPPYVQDFTGYGSFAAPNATLMLGFNEMMDTSTLTGANVKLYNMTGQSPVEVTNVTVTFDSNTRRHVILDPSSNLSTGHYEVRVLGAVKNQDGVSMMPNNPTGIAFTAGFEVQGEADTVPPDIFPFIPDGSTGVEVGQNCIRLGFSEPMLMSTLTPSNISLARGATTTPVTTEYEPGPNNICLIPSNVLAPNTTYTVTFGTGIKDAANVALTSARTFSFTTGAMDTSSPVLRQFDCRFDDYAGFLSFSEPMQDDSNSGTNYEDSVLNPDNYTLTFSGSPLVDRIDSNVNMSYDSMSNGVNIEKVSGGTSGETFTLTVTDVTDISGNAIDTANGINICRGKVESSAATFGNMGGGGGMFGPPVTFNESTGGFGGTAVMPGGGGSNDYGGAGKEYKMGDFGNFTADQRMFGESINAYASNPTAGATSNVFQINIPSSALGGALQDGDQLVFTFPTGTGVAGAKPDPYSPYRDDFNQWNPGIIAFDNNYSTDGVAGNASTLTVTVQIEVQIDAAGSPTATDFNTIDLAGIVNPIIPGNNYTVGIKLVRAGIVEKTLTSGTYFINEAGTNDLTVRVCASSNCQAVAGADGDVFVMGGGPAGPMERTVTLTNGVITAVDGTEASSIQYTNLNDGCYGIHTEPFVSLSNGDYFGKDMPEPICFWGGNQERTYDIVLSAAAGGGSVPVNVVVTKTGGTFNNVSADVFAGGPGRFIKKTVTLNGASTSTTLNLPSNGFWFVGVGPAMAKGSSKEMPDLEAFGGMPPPSVDVEVSGLPGAGAVGQGMMMPPMGVAFNDNTDTLTYTIRANNIQVPVLVTDGTNGLANVEVFMHQQGFGAPSFGRTANDGTVTLRVADYGPYEIGAFAWGVGDTKRQIDVRDVNGSTKVYMNGSLVNPVTLKLLKSDYTISGTVFDKDNNPIPYAPVWAEENTEGRFVPGGTDFDGKYTISVSAGTWTLRSMLPPDKSELCGTFEKTVTVTNESQSGQNIVPTQSTCYTLSGTVTLGGTAREGTWVNVESWDTTTDRPTGAFMRGSPTDSSGNYSVEAPAGTYLVRVWDPDYGEIADTTTVTNADKDFDLSSGTLGTLTFNFTGGAAGMTGWANIDGTDEANSRVHFGKPFNGTDQALTFSVKEGNYEYAININGVGYYEGTAATGTPVAISLASVSMETVSGTVYDDSGNPLANSVVILHNPTDNTDISKKTDSSGNYSIDVKGGSYEISASRAGYTAPETATVTVSADADYDFGGATAEAAALDQNEDVISGTIYKSDGTTPMTSGTAWAENTVTGEIVTDAVEPDGTYDLNVSDGTWTISATGPMHDAEESTYTVNTTDAIADTGKNLTLTANAEHDPSAFTTDVSLDTAMTVNAMHATDTDISANKGTIGSSGDATIVIEKGYDAPPTESFVPVDNISYNVDIQSDAGTVKDFSGQAEFTFEYDPTLLPTNVTESELTVSYYNTDAGEYVPCEGGVIRDTTANTITCVTTHATTFSIGYAPSAAIAAATTTGSRRDNTQQIVQESGGGGGAAPSAPATDSNTTTSTISSKFEAEVTTAMTIDRPIKIDAALMKTDSAAKTKTADLTSDTGTLVLKPNKDAAVAVEIAPDTAVTGSQDWNGNITPPLVKPVTLINKGGESVEGSTQQLTRDNVATVVYVGSSTSSLTFSKPVKVKVPLTNLKDGDKVQVYSSEDGDHWKLLAPDKFTVSGGRISFQTTHFTYFAVVKTGEVDQVVAAEAAKKEEQPKEEAAKAETAKPAVTAVMPFRDVLGHWSREFVQDLYDLGVISGKTAAAFAPDDPITRAEITKIALNAFGYDVPVIGGAKPFKDVDPFAWYAPYVQIAKSEKVVSGYEDGTFRPNQPVTRAEALKILAGAAKLTVDPKAVFLFRDTVETAWYMKFVAFAKANDIAAGYPDGTFRPNASITRAEVVKIAVKMMGME